MPKARSEFEKALRSKDTDYVVGEAARQTAGIAHLAKLWFAQEGLAATPADIVALTAVMAQTQHNDMPADSARRTECRDEARLGITMENDHGVYRTMFGDEDEGKWVVSRSCARCHLSPTAEGHDPCIAKLPGVAYACCGHGSAQGYVAMQDGPVFRFTDKNGTQIREAVLAVRAGETLPKDWHFDAP